MAIEPIPLTAAGPTELRRYLGHAFVATCLIAGLPLWVVVNLGNRFGSVTSVVAIGVSMGLAQLGNQMWQRHPGSRDIVFHDLMLWGYLRRLRAPRDISKKAKRLGLNSDVSGARALSPDEQARLLKKLAVALEDGDPYTHGHSQRVARHSYMIAKAMRLSRREREQIRLAAIVHDVGKLRIPKTIINKPGALSDAEYDIIKSHSALGADMVSKLGDPELTAMVRQHHERLDGSGYPDNLPGSEMCLGARIIAVADTFDATSSQRPYREAKPYKVSLDILNGEAGHRLDPTVVDAFVRYYSGRRSFKWWAVSSVAPAHLRELGLLVAQRLGVAGLANAAVVGATVVALTPGSPLRPATHYDAPKPQVRANVQHDAPGGTNSSSPVTHDGRQSESESNEQGSGRSAPDRLRFASANASDKGRRNEGPKEKPDKRDRQVRAKGKGFEPQGNAYGYFGRDKENASGADPGSKVKPTKDKGAKPQDPAQPSEAGSGSDNAGSRAPKKDPAPPASGGKDKEQTPPVEEPSPADGGGSNPSTTQPETPADGGPGKSVEAPGNSGGAGNGSGPPDHSNGGGKDK